MQKRNFYVPSEVLAGSRTGHYLRSSIPVLNDFYHPDYAIFLKKINHRFIVHRKLWEFAYIYDRLSSVNMIESELNGLCFGAGKEPLPSLFAAQGANIVATDAPPGVTHGDWTQKNEYSQQKEDLFRADLVSREVFDERVRFELCDMNAIPTDLVDFDFCWSACCLEHLGSLKHGIDFIIESVEKTLKVGGYACHTTEMNLTSDVETVETPNLSLYRKQDLLRLISKLESRGHKVEALNIEIGATAVDYYVDLPPYADLPHIKILFDNYVSTSVGLFVQRGR